MRNILNNRDNKRFVPFANKMLKCNEVINGQGQYLPDGGILTGKAVVAFGCLWGSGVDSGRIIASNMNIIHNLRTSAITKPAPDFDFRLMYNMLCWASGFRVLSNPEWTICLNSAGYSDMLLISIR